MADQKSPDSGGKLTQFPTNRVKTIMKSSPDLVHISQESVFLITKSTELFVEYLTQEAFREGKGKGKSLSYKGLSHVVDDQDCLQFLGDIIPPKVLARDYLESLKKKEEKKTIEIDSSSDSDSE